MHVSHPYAQGREMIQKVTTKLRKGRGAETDYGVRAVKGASGDRKKGRHEAGAQTKLTRC